MVVLDRVKNNLPDFYDKSSDSIITSFVNAFTNEINITESNIISIQNLNSIDTTDGDDLSIRWGALLSIPRLTGESNDAYRARIKLVVTSLNGGTMDSIKYSVAVGMGLREIPETLYISDGWKPYTGSNDTISSIINTIPSENKVPGNIFCIIDLENGSYSIETESIIRNSINSVKAAGINTFVALYNYRVENYLGLNDITYASLNTLEYDKIGG